MKIEEEKNKKKYRDSINFAGVSSCVNLYGKTHST